MSQYSDQLTGGRAPLPGGEAGRPGAPRNDPAQPFRVLVVEDAAIVGERLVERIRALAPTAEISTVATGEAALAVFGRERVDAVILDFQLPDLSGYDVLIQMRWMQPASAVFMLTQETYPEFRQHALRLGARQCFHKPTQFELAIAAVADLAKSTATRDSSAAPGAAAWADEA